MRLTKPLERNEQPLDRGTLTARLLKDNGHFICPILEQKSYNIMTRRIVNYITIGKLRYIATVNVFY